LDTLNRYAGLPARTIRRIRFLASKLNRQNAIPGMDREDIEQDLVLDLLQRIGRHDPARASLETFAEHVLDNRVATLTRPCARLRTERQMMSIGTPSPASDRDAEWDQLPEDSLITGNCDADPASIENELSLRLDMERFVGNLAPALRLCAEIMANGNVAEGASNAGLHRSTIYERLAHLRAEAAAIGLHEYLGPRPTLSSLHR
jgi:hypothetical protein